MGKTLNHEWETDIFRRDSSCSQKRSNRKRVCIQYKMALLPVKGGLGGRPSIIFGGTTGLGGETAGFGSASGFGRGLGILGGAISPVA